MAVTAKDCHAMTSYYEKLYKAKYKTAPNVNRYSARWGFDAILQTYSTSEAKQLVDYYFTTPPTRKHDLDWFFYHYHELVESMRKAAKDAAHRTKLMEESKQRAERWRNSGKPSITDN